MKQVFELHFTTELVKATAEHYGFKTDMRVKIKGEFRIEEVAVLQAAAVAEFIARLDETFNKAIESGSFLS